MIERLPCKPAPTSCRPLIEWVVVCALVAVLIYMLGG